MFLYKLTNRKSGLSYIGATTRKRLNDRLALHRHRARKGDRTSLLHLAIAEDGWESFDVMILGEPETREALLIGERAAILALGTLQPHGYNMTSGGDGQWDRPMTEKNKRAISRTNRGRHPWNHGQKTGPMSQEARLHMSLARKGSTPWNRGVAISEATMEKILAKCAHAVTIAGVTYVSISEASRKTGLSRMQIRYRARH